MFNDNEREQILEDYITLKINRGLVAFLKDQGIDAKSAELYDLSSQTQGWGCDTCGTWTEETVEIRYIDQAGKSHLHIEQIDHLNFFPTLYKYMEK